MEEKCCQFCQSCGMPMGDTNEMYGTEANGNKSQDCCKYCYDDGKFTIDCTMDEMIEVCVPHMTASNEGMDSETARNMMKEFFPKLKRWQ